MAYAHSSPANSVETSALAGICDAVKQFCEEYDYDTCRDIASITADRLHRTATQTPAVIEAEARNIQTLLSREVHYQKFLWISKSKSEYVDNDNLFGRAVTDAFPSSSRDIREAGNCLAAECGTGAVFHLMRACEFSLRALARDRDIEFKDKPLDEKEWGQILDVLESKVGKLNRADRALWVDSKARDMQLRYYSGLVQELRSFNVAWRRHISHADVRAFYDAEEAMGIFNHVRTFMQNISERISETTITPEIWAQERNKATP